MRRGLILFAHGARSASWSRPLDALASEFAAAAPELTVRRAFLELQAPNLPTVIDELAPTHDHLDVLPVFWSAGGHVARDLPALLEAARARHPGLSLQVLPVISELPGLVPAIARAALAAGARTGTRSGAPAEGG
jgi:sirohydrochlorin cobaltochelatase